MVKIWTTLWLIFTAILLAFPIWLLIVFLVKRWRDIGKAMTQKVNNIKALEKMKNDLLKQSAKETAEENNITTEEVIISAIFDNNPNEEVEEEKTPEEMFATNAVEIEDNSNKTIQEKQKKLLDKINYEANALKKEWKLEDYEKKLIEWLAIEPENLDLNKQLAELYFTIWNHKKALSLLKKIIEKDPEDHNAIWQIWEIYLVTWDFETSELLIEKAINLKPNNPKYYISMVEIMYNTDRKKDAVAVMEKIVKLRPTNANYIMTLAELYDEIQDFDNAKKYYFRVLEQEPNNEKAKRKIQELSVTTTII